MVIWIGDIKGDGLNELLVTFMVNRTYKSRIYGINCVFTCNIDLWSIDYTDLDGMTAVPFIFDRYSNGSVSIFTFKGTERIIITAIPLKKAMYKLISCIGIHSLGEIWSIMGLRVT